MIFGIQRETATPCVLFSVSLVIYMAFSYLLPITFFPDSEQYVRTALAMNNDAGGEYYYYRTWGYPILLRMLFVPTAETFVPVLAAQLVMAALIPVLAYATVRNVYPKLALLAGIVVMVSVSPVLYAKLIMTDQVSMFYRFLILYLASILFFQDHTWRLHVFMLVVGLALFMMRPSDALLFILIPVVALVFGMGKRTHLIVVLAAFLAITSAWKPIQDSIARDFMIRSTSTSVVGSMTGKMLFFNVYAVGPKITTGPTVSPGNGPASKEFYDALVEWGQKKPARRCQLCRTGRKRISRCLCRREDA